VNSDALICAIYNGMAGSSVGLNQSRELLCVWSHHTAGRAVNVIWRIEWREGGDGFDFGERVGKVLDGAGGKTGAM